MTRFTPGIRVLMLALVATTVSPPLVAKDIVVDVQHPLAADTNAGTPGAPFKTIQAAADMAQPGDAVRVKPGRYPETVKLKTAGEPGKPIVFRSDPPRLAMLDGSEPLIGWQRCTSADACWGNPNWQKIFITTLPEGATLFTANLYEGNEILFFSQDPPPGDPYVWDDRTVLWPCPVAGYSGTTIVDPSRLNQEDPGYWVGATVIVWTANNAVVPRQITDFDPAAGKITFKMTTRHLNVGKDRYGVMNHPALVRAPGQYAVGRPDANGRRKVYLWPREENSLDGRVTVSVRKVGFHVNGKSYVHIEGFKIRRYSGALDDLRAGQGILNIHGQPACGVVIRNNEVYQCRAGCGYWAINMADCCDLLIQSNYVHHNPMNRGIGATGSKSRGHLTNVLIKDNVIERAGGTGINFYWVQDSRIVGNTVKDSQSNHGNGITVYLFSENVLVSGNTVLRSNMGITVQQSTGVTITNNLIVGQENQSRLLVLYGNGGGNIAVLNNTVLNSSTQSGISLPRVMRDYSVKNNLTDGIAVHRQSDRSGLVLENNVYTGLTWNMKPDQIGRDGKIQRDLSKLFVDSESGDYRLQAGSPAIDAGANVSDVVNTDILGTSRPQGAAMDIGAYEYKR